MLDTTLRADRAGMMLLAAGLVIAGAAGCGGAATDAEPSAAMTTSAAAETADVAEEEDALAGTKTELREAIEATKDKELPTEITIPVDPENMKKGTVSVPLPATAEQISAAVAAASEDDDTGGLSLDEDTGAFDSPISITGWTADLSLTNLIVGDAGNQKSASELSGEEIRAVLETLGRPDTAFVRRFEHQPPVLTEEFQLFWDLPDGGALRLVFSEETDTGTGEVRDVTLYSSDMLNAVEFTDYVDNDSEYALKEQMGPQLEPLAFDQ